MNLPTFHNEDKQFQLLQTRWASILNPLLNRPQNNSIILKNVSLSTGSNIINHRLGKALQGWSIVRLRGAAQIYDTQDSNQTPDLTLTLTSNANVSCDIEVF